MIGNALQIIQWLTGQKQGVEWEIKRHRQKRSLSQNSYYWKLVGMISDDQRLPKSVVHNKMLRDYGQLMSIEGRLIPVDILDTEKAEEKALRLETVHLKPTSQVRMGSKKQMFRTYVMLRGSHDYDSREMSILLDGAVQEAQNLGIETLKPYELEALKVAELNHAG